MYNMFMYLEDLLILLVPENMIYQVFHILQILYFLGKANSLLFLNSHHFPVVLLLYQGVSVAVFVPVYNMGV